MRYYLNNRTEMSLVAV